MENKTLDEKGEEGNEVKNSNLKKMDLNMKKMQKTKELTKK